MRHEERNTAIIDRAIALIETVGWIQGEVSSDKGYCIMGAIATAIADYGLVGEPAIKAIKHYKEKIKTLMKGVRIPVGDWNDAKDRTKEDILRVLHGLKTP